MKIGLPEEEPGRGGNNQKKETKRKPNKKKKPKKVLPENIRWRDNGDTISAKINKQIVYIDKNTFNIQLKNGFVIKCKDMDDAKNKAILLFNK